MPQMNNLVIAHYSRWENADARRPSSADRAVRTVVAVLARSAAVRAGVLSASTAQHVLTAAIEQHMLTLMDAPELAARASDTVDFSSGLRAVAALRRLVETLELRQVERALVCGASWIDIATDLGVSRQAVHRKYARRLRQARHHSGEEDR